MMNVVVIKAIPVQQTRTVSAFGFGARAPKRKLTAAPGTREPNKFNLALNTCNFECSSTKFLLVIELLQKARCHEGALLLTP